MLEQAVVLEIMPYSTARCSSRIMQLINNNQGVLDLHLTGPMKEIRFSRNSRTLDYREEAQERSTSANSK